VRFPWRPALGIAASVAILAWALHGMSWHDVTVALETLRTSDWRLWLAATVISQTIFPLRAIRWRPILAGIVPQLPFGPLWRSTAIGVMLNNAGLRLGELARAYALTREQPTVPLTGALTSLVVDRAFDGIVVLLLLIVALVDPAFSLEAQFGTRTVGVIVAAAAIALAVAVGGLYLAVFAPKRMSAVVLAVTRRLARHHEGRVALILEHVAAGLSALRDPRRFLAVFLWTLAHWIVHAVAVWVSFRALGFDVPFTAALFAQGLLAMGAAAVPTPGFIGVFEAAGTVALVNYGIGEADALTWALSYHLLTLLPITLIGMWYVARLGLTLDEVRRARIAGAES
jgi:uncharacterized protein (TIRG00374 family)